MGERSVRPQLLTTSAPAVPPTAISRPGPAGWLTRFRPELLVFAVALALRLGLFLAVGAWDPERLDQRIFVGDARDYHRLAVNLVEHGVYSSRREPPLEPDVFRVPLYSGYLAGTYRLFGPLPHLAILLQLGLGALTCAVVCRLGTLLFDRRTGIVAGSILAVDYSSILFSNRLYADTLFTLLVALTLWAVARFLAGGRNRALIAAGLFAGLATLCRPVSLYFVLALVPVFWLRCRARPGLACGRWVLLAAICLLTLSPWMWRNFRVAGRPYVTSMQAEVGEWYLPSSVGERAEEEEEKEREREVERTASAARPSGGTGAATSSARSGAPRRDRRGSMSVSHLLADARAFGRGFVRYFAILGSGEIPLILGIPYRQHDFVALRGASLGGWVAATLRNRSRPFERALVLSIVAYLAVLYLAAARGLLVSARRGKWVEATLLLATIGYFMVATGPIAREVRYRLPALPAIVVLAALGLPARARAPQLRAEKSLRSK